MNGKTNAENNVRVYNLGEGQTFDISGIPGYQNVTIDNFVVGFTGATARAGDCEGRGYCAAGATTSCAIKKSYNSETGILTITGNYNQYYNSGANKNVSVNTAGIFAYLIIGKVKMK